MTTADPVPLSVADLLVRVRTVQAGLKLAENRLRQQARTEMAPGDRRMGTGPVRDGKVTLSPGGELAARITDEAALTEWVVQYYPDLVQPVIRPWALEDLKAASVKAGAPRGPGGELIPGIEVVETEPELKVFASPEGSRWVAEQWAAVVSGLSALTGGK